MSTSKILHVKLLHSFLTIFISFSFFLPPGPETRAALFRFPETRILVRRKRSRFCLQFSDMIHLLYSWFASLFTYLCMAFTCPQAKDSWILLSAGLMLGCWLTWSVLVVAWRGLWLYVLLPFGSCGFFPDRLCPTRNLRTCMTIWNTAASRKDIDRLCVWC